jgi:hypothetical protein
MKMPEKEILCAISWWILQTCPGFSWEKPAYLGSRRSKQTVFKIKVRKIQNLLIGALLQELM